MVSNSPSMPFKWIKRAHYRDYPDDLRPSHLASFMAHVPGTVVEIVAPLTLLFSPWPWLTVDRGGDHGRVPPVHHLDVPAGGAAGVERAVRLRDDLPVPRLPELGRLRGRGHVLAVADRRHPAGLLFFPVLGNLRPDLVSFLPAMRQYAGNWASALWAFAPGAEEKLNRVTRSAGNQVDQLVAFGYEPQWAEISMQQPIAWRSMHSQGRGLFSVLLKTSRHRQPDRARGGVRL